MARRYIRDKMGRFSGGGGGASPVTRSGRLRGPKEANVLQVGKQRAAFSSSDAAQKAYTTHLSQGNKGKAMLWNKGRVQADSSKVSKGVVSKMQKRQEKERNAAIAKEPSLASKAPRTALQFSDKKSLIVQTGKGSRRRRR
jgi:hypothetical protein